MLKRVALIKDNLVENITVYNPEGNWVPPSEYFVMDVSDMPYVDIGMMLGEDGFYRPEPESPDQV